MIEFILIFISTVVEKLLAPWMSIIKGNEFNFLDKYKSMSCISHKMYGLVNLLFFETITAEDFE